MLASFGVAEQTSRLFSKMDTGRGSAHILVVSDSTAAGTGLWPDLVTCWLAERYPSHDVAFVPWNEYSQSYDRPLPRQSGTGPPGRPGLR